MNKRGAERHWDHEENEELTKTDNTAEGTLSVGEQDQTLWIVYGYTSLVLFLLEGRKKQTAGILSKTEGNIFKSLFI